MDIDLSAERIEILNYIHDGFRHEIRRDVLKGLTPEQKCIPSKYFYDAYGSRLFREICRLPEYYQTRTELSILENSANLIMKNFRKGDIIELGSGENLKIRTLLNAAFTSPAADICYMPVDVSESTLIESSRELIGIYSDLRVVGIVADFTKHLENIPLERKKLFVFLGSTIGNFSNGERQVFLKAFSCLMGPHDRFLLGIDMIKPAEILELAYNDLGGVTAEFNKNILSVVNRELKADFDKSHFDHLAFYNGAEEQVEMHLRANRDVSVEIEDLDLSISLRKGETVHTEICRKFSRRSTENMAEEAGLKISRWFTDPRGWFSLVELVPPGSLG